MIALAAVLGAAGVFGLVVISAVVVGGRAERRHGAALAVLAIAAAAAAPGIANAAPRLELIGQGPSVHVCSRHFCARSTPSGRQLNWRTWGAGLGLQVGHWTLAGGTYHDTDFSESRYVSAIRSWSIETNGSWQLKGGIGAGLIAGYPDHPAYVPALLASLTVWNSDVGAGLVVMPPADNSLAAVTSDFRWSLPGRSASRSSAWISMSAASAADNIQGMQPGGFRRDYHGYALSAGGAIGAFSISGSYRIAEQRGSDYGSMDDYTRIPSIRIAELRAGITRQAGPVTYYVGLAAAAANSGYHTYWQSDQPNIADHWHAIHVRPEASVGIGPVSVSYTQHPWQIQAWHSSRAWPGHGNLATWSGPAALTLRLSPSTTSIHPILAVAWLDARAPVSSGRRIQVGIVGQRWSLSIGRVTGFERDLGRYSTAFPNGLITAYPMQPWLGYVSGDYISARVRAGSLQLSALYMSPAATWRYSNRGDHRVSRSPRLAFRIGWSW